MVQQKILIMKINNNKGFNLLMLCVVIMALSILMSSVLGFYSITNYKRRLQTTNERFQAIDLAIKNYIFKNHRFPCPAPLNCNTGGCKTSGDSLGVSRSVDDDGNCVVGNPQNGVFKSTNSETGKEIYYGGVPAITLGLENTHIVDAWGNKIAYIIPKELTEKESDQIFYYTKNHEIDPENPNIVVGNEIKTLDKKYVKDGIVDFRISINVKKQGAYAYKNTKVNPFSGTKNYPIENFEVDTSANGLLFFKKNVHNFSVGKAEEQIQVCPRTQIKYLGQDFYFESAIYGEIRFSNEMCPYHVTITSVQESDEYYLSNYKDSQGILIDNRMAKRCGRDGQWENGLVFSCEKLPKCGNPGEDSRYSSGNWDHITFPIVNMGEVQEADNKFRLKCFCNYNTEDENPENHHYECKWYEIKQVENTSTN